MSVAEGMTFRLLSSVLNSNYKNSMPADRHPHVIPVYTSNALKLKQKLGIENSKTSFVYLCDSSSRIRWIATGIPTNDELKNMVMLTRQLLVKQD